MKLSGHITTNITEILLQTKSLSLVKIITAWKNIVGNISHDAAPLKLHTRSGKLTLEIGVSNNAVGLEIKMQTATLIGKINFVLQAHVVESISVVNRSDLWRGHAYVATYE